MAYTKEFLSGTPANGRQIKIVETASPGTLLHAAHASNKDELWIFIYNSDSVAREVTIEFGGTSADDQVKKTISPKDGRFLVIEGEPLSGSLVVRAFCATANVLFAAGFANRIS